jgi:polyhydroxyalkanoate synthesis repressor PhaR
VPRGAGNAGAARRRKRPEDMPMTDTSNADFPIQASAQPPVVVKKYANRRLYNTETSSYITLDNLAEMVRAGRDFVVYDARSGDDITRGVLTQIIVEEENKGRALLPTTFLRQLIGFYGDSIGGVVPRYLEQTMSTIARQQEQMRDAVKTTMGSLLPPGLEEMRRQNVAMMERAMSLFSPFYRPNDAETGEPSIETAMVDEIAALKREVEELRSQLAARPDVRPLRKV